MPSVNTIITALVASLAIGAQAGPCRPHPPPTSVVESQVTTTAYAQPTAETSAAYSDVVSKSQTEISLSATKQVTTSEKAETESSLPTTAVQVTSSEEVETKPVTADETTTTYYSAAELASVVSDSLTTQATVESTSAAQETTSAIPSTTEESSATLHTTTSVPSSTSEAEVVPSTTSSEPQTTNIPTTTSEPTTTTSQASTTTSEAATSGCANKSNITCGKTGFFSSSINNLLDVVYDQDTEQCKAKCEENKDCKTIGITTTGQCELYDASVSILGFEPRDSWYYSVWDACCFEDEQ
ncbi:hypothetical protein FLONG3_10768 [Fusarium longipes]|uniref:Apple domain-containing protein n=1 Tax=Fusarium longipes TaxID=694270 RepID=A0A395RLH4_9HYPO|nr:hypothetical protein FLONG3_10768 [Fusarium longipes]